MFENDEQIYFWNVKLDQNNAMPVIPDAPICVHQSKFKSLKVTETSLGLQRSLKAGLRNWPGATTITENR